MTDPELKVMDARQAVHRLFELRECDLSKEAEVIQEIYDMALSLLRKAQPKKEAA